LAVRAFDLAFDLALWCRTEAPSTLARSDRSTGAALSRSMRIDERSAGAHADGVRGGSKPARFGRFAGDPGSRHFMNHLSSTTRRASTVFPLLTRTKYTPGGIASSARSRAFQMIW